MKLRNPSALLACILPFFAGCAVGPDYVRPAVDTPALFKEAGTPGDWKPAEPRDDAPRGAWWTLYGDARLNALVEQVAVDNQNVRAAEATYRQALAALGVARSGGWPTLSSGLSASRGEAATTAGGTTVSSVRTTDRLSLSVSWEADVWGRIGRTVEANEANAQAGAADLRAALLSAQATLVQSYLQLRANDAARQLLDQTVGEYRRSLRITRNRYEGGVAGRSDVVQAETQLKTAEAQAVDLGIQRAQLEHTIALLVGKAPAAFSLAAEPALPALPEMPAAIPSQLLERRPDIAAAERRIAAANAQIGVAQAAYFPALTLGGTLGYQNDSFSQLLTAPNRFWSLGPALALTLFDGGARAAAKEGALAGYDKSVATYRQTVLGAFQEIEDNLAALRVLAEEAGIQQQAATAANELLKLTNNQYLAGTVSYLNVASAQAAALSAERGRLDIQSRRLLASVALLKALGGDWRKPAAMDRKAVG